VRTRWILLLSVFALLLGTIPAAANGSAGASAAAFLRHPVGARPAGMGGAFTAIADDANALYFNPGALPRTEWLACQGSSAFLSMDRAQYEGVVVLNLPELAAFGLSVNRFGISDIDRRDATGNPIGTFDDSELALTLGAGRQLLPNLGVGASFRYLRHSLADVDASGFGFDVGLHSRIEVDMEYVNAVNVGVSFSNLGADLEWDTPSSHTDEIDVTRRLGAAVEAAATEEIELLAAIDGVKTGDLDAEFHLGAEAWYREMLALRLGYNDVDATFGASVRLRGIRLDFVYTPDELDEGATKAISLHFGREGF
jgi:hypothetical protein